MEHLWLRCDKCELPAPFFVTGEDLLDSEGVIACDQCGEICVPAVAPAGDKLALEQPVSIRKSHAHLVAYHNGKQVQEGLTERLRALDPVAIEQCGICAGDVVSFEHYQVVDGMTLAWDGEWKVDRFQYEEIVYSDRLRFDHGWKSVSALHRTAVAAAFLAALVTAFTAVLMMELTEDARIALCVGSVVGMLVRILVDLCEHRSITWD